MGIVSAVSSTLFEHRCNITESAQFGDPETNRFFMRVCFDGASSAARFSEAFGAVGQRFGMQWAVHDQARKTRVILRDRSSSRTSPESSME